MANIGFISYWGIGRGRAMVTLAYTKMLMDTHNVFILKEGKNPIFEKKFNVPVDVTDVEKFDPSPEVFSEWVKKNDLDVVVFNEYGQWTDKDNGLPELAKELGLRTYGFLVYEKFKPEQADRYDKVLVPSVTGERFMRKNKVRNFEYVPYSLDLEEYQFDKKQESKDGVFKFIHPGGFGGVHNRKNTELVIKAFEKMTEKGVENVELLITSQKPLECTSFPQGVSIIQKNLSHQELLGLVREADMTLLPSKWETIGIPILESMAVGTPSIVPDLPPMNEFIREGMNGLLCKCSTQHIPGISVRAADISVHELEKKMNMVVHLKRNSREFYDVLRKQSIKVSRDLYDLDKNKRYFLEFLEKDLS